MFSSILIFILVLVFRSYCFSTTQECWNGGYLKGNDEWCTCTKYFENSGSVPGRCDWKSCAGRGSLQSNNTCSCSSGWTGVHCEQCTNDVACMKDLSLNGSVYPNGICRKSVFSYERMNFMCEVTAPEVLLILGTHTTFQCEGVGFSENIPLHARKECYFQGWNHFQYNNEIFFGQTVSCQFSRCAATVTEKRSMIYRCEESSCLVPFREFNDLHKQDYVPLFDIIVGFVEVECWEKGWCELRISDLPTAKIEFQCEGSECLPKDVVPDFPGSVDADYEDPSSKKDVRNMLLMIIPSLVVLCLVLVIGVSLFDIFLIYRTQIEKRALEKYENNAGGELSFKNLYYHVYVTNRLLRKMPLINRMSHKLQILENLSYKIERGQLVAVMGSTGAGKTTLLDILAQRNKTGKISGKILLNTNKPGSTSRRLTGYVVQEDCLMGTMTVKECIKFSAELRLPVTLCGKEKEKKVENVMKQLGIYHLRDRKIGDYMTRGISGGEKKIVSVALELVVNPHLLFLDEPTSGLDSHTAYQLVSSLKLLTLEQGRTILMAIHQPRAKIFKMFDTLLLLSKGKFVYAGKATEVVKCFEERYCQKFIGGVENPADWILDLVSREERRIEALEFSKGRRRKRKRRRRRPKSEFDSSSYTSSFDISSSSEEEDNSSIESTTSSSSSESEMIKKKRRSSYQLPISPSPPSSSTGMVDEEELLLLTDKDWVAKFAKCTYYGENYPEFRSPFSCTIGLTKFCVFIQFPTPTSEEDSSEVTKSSFHPHSIPGPPGREIIIYYKSITNMSEFVPFKDVVEVEEQEEEEDGKDQKKKKKKKCYIFQVEWQDRFFVDFKNKKDFELCKNEIEKLQYKDLVRANKNNLYSSSGVEIDQQEYEEEEEEEIISEEEEEEYIVDGNFKLISKKDDILVYNKTDLMRYATPLSTQIWGLSKRYFVHFIRNYYLLPMHVGSAILLGLLMGNIYFQTEMNFGGAQNRFGVMFFMCSIMSFTSLSGLEIFIKERPLFVRERANNYYYPFVYFIVKVLFDMIPLRVIPPLFMGSICYYMVGLNPSITNFIMFLLMIVLFNILSGAMVILIGTISSTVAFANIFGTLLMLLNSVFGGFLVNRKAMPEWISWLRYMSYWNYVYENLMINELAGRRITASEDVGLPYEIIVPGEEVLQMFGMKKENFVTNIVIAFSMFLLFLTISGVYVQVFIKEWK